MSAHDLVFGAGDRIRGWGEYLVDADGAWLDLQLTSSLVAWDPPRPPRHSDRSVRVAGVDPTAVPTTFGDGGVVPGHVTLTGMWDGETLRVQEQSARRPAGFADDDDLPEWTVPPCPSPTGGWPTGVDGGWAENLDFEVGDLLETGAAVTLVTFRPGPDQVVLVVAATDAARVREVLGPQLPDRLCVVTSRWTRAQLVAVRDVLVAHWEDWSIDTIGEPCDESAQTWIEVQLMRVPPELARWADTVSPGLLTLRPSLRPVP